MAQGKNRDKKGSVDTERENTSSSRRGGKFLYLFLGVAFLLVLLIGGALAAFKLGLLSNLLGAGLQAQNQKEAFKEPEFMYEVPEIVVNFNGLDRRRFLSVKFYLGFDEPKLQQELDKRMPEIRDAVNKILWVKDADDLSTPEGKEALREEIFETINSMLYSGELRGVYFWHLMIQ